MERTRLELLFDQELLQNAEQARILWRQSRDALRAQRAVRGGVSAVRELCRRNRPSDAFEFACTPADSTCPRRPAPSRANTARSLPTTRSMPALRCF